MRSLTFCAILAVLAGSALAQDSPAPPPEGQGNGQGNGQGQGSPQDAPKAPDVDPNRPNENYPYWVTNDYDCVMECLKPFEAQDIPNPAPELEKAAYGCIADKCNKEWMGNNMYQGSYIIQMRYATGSIYEDAKMGEWGQGSPPKQDNGAVEGEGDDAPKDESPSAAPSSSQPATSSPASSTASVATITTSSPSETGHKNETSPAGGAQGGEKNGAVIMRSAGATWMGMLGVLLVSTLYLL